MTKRPLDRTKVRQSVLLALFLVLVALQVLLSYEVEEGFSMRQILTMGVGIALYALFALSLLGVYAARRREVRAGRALALLQAEKDALEQQLNERAQAEQAQQEAEAQEGVQRDELVARLGAAEGPDLPQEFFRIVAERWQLVQGLLFARQGDDLYGVTHTYAYYPERGDAHGPGGEGARAALPVRPPQELPPSGLGTGAKRAEASVHHSASGYGRASDGGCGAGLFLRLA